MSSVNQTWTIAGVGTIALSIQTEKPLSVDAVDCVGGCVATIETLVELLTPAPPPGVTP